MGYYSVLQKTFFNFSTILSTHHVAPPLKGRKIWNLLRGEYNKIDVVVKGKLKIKTPLVLLSRLGGQAAFVTKA